MAFRTDIKDMEFKRLSTRKGCELAAFEMTLNEKKLFSALLIELITLVKKTMIVSWILFRLFIRLETLEKSSLSVILT